MLDLRPATDELARLVAGISDDDLTADTPCADTPLAAMLDHVDSLALAFTQAAAKTAPPDGGPPPAAAAENLTADWRTRIPERLGALADAWRVPDAWTGMTGVGGLQLPGEVTGAVAIDELIVHGWDIAVATGQQLRAEPQLVEAAYGFVRATAAQNPTGVPGLFGPPVDVADDAPLLDRLIALTGRDPARTV